MFAREGYPLMLGTAAFAVVLFALALRARSWPLWLLAFVVTIVALGLAWSLRNLSPA
jgi:uncharacterized membrane protein AbrB (regulator of aidB expression)